MTALLPMGTPATVPPERRGLARDGVRLLAVAPGRTTSAHFSDLPDLLDPGDLLVVNTSATLPARLTARRADGATTPLHVSTTLDDGSWVVEVRRRTDDGPETGLEPGAALDLPGGVRLVLRDGFPDPAAPRRLWRAHATPAVGVPAYLARYGRPVHYAHLTAPVSLADVRNVYATEPGSAENASAGRPFTDRLLVRLVARGVPVVPLVLHAGVSSPELHEPPAPERYRVPEVTARLVTATRAAGRRVVAVGTTVTRALETVTGDDGVTRPGEGWTDLVLGPDRPARAVSGLLTGLHEPEASHVLLLEAVAGPELVARGYRAAVDGGYLWHEFGDSMLFLPGGGPATDRRG